jgi:L-iditol 2-dehydrogenase
VRKGGVVNFVGGPPSGTVVGLDTNRLHYGDITLKASFHHTPAACASAFALICGGTFKCADFITSTAKLEDVPAVFARMMTRSSENFADIKTAIFPNGNGSNGNSSMGSRNNETSNGSAR